MTTDIQRILQKIMAGDITPTRELNVCMEHVPSDLESIIDRFQHGDCHFWTLALMSKMHELEAVVLTRRSDRMIIHSLAAVPGRNVLIDAGGVWTMRDAGLYWEEVLGEPCTLKTADATDMLVLTCGDSEKIKDAQAHLDLWAQLSHEALMDVDDQPSPP